MTGRGDHRVAVVECFRIDRVAERAPQRVDADAVACRDAQRTRGKREAGTTVDFVDRLDQALVVAERGQQGGRGGGVVRGVGHAEYDPCAGRGGKGPFDAHAFQPVVGAAQACGVDEAEEHAVDVQGLLNGVARGAGNVGNHGAFLAQKPVQQRGLAGIGCADDRHAHALLQGIAQREAAAQGVELGADFLHDAVQLRAVGELHVFFREVEFEFEQRGQVQQAVAQCVQRVGESAAHLSRGEGMGCARRRGDQVGDRLGLRKVHLACEKRPGGEFARFGGAGSRGVEQAQNLGHDVGGAVAGEFHRVFARVGAGGAEDSGEHFVHRAVAVCDAAEAYGVCGGVGEARRAPEDAVADGDGLRAADADHGHGAARGGGRCGDGVVRVEHGVIGLRCGFSVPDSACGRS